MADFRPSYYYSDAEMNETQPNIEDPIFPISQLGTTVPERDPAGRFKNMIQGIQANIRKGAGTMQMVLMTGPESAIGGRPKAYGKDVREAIREVAKANEVKVKGFEMPTSMNNLSGFDHQRNRFSDEQRQLYLDEIRDAIKFAADTAGGGGVDMVSWEFPRQINTAAWNTDQQFHKAGEHKIGSLVDDRTGQLQQFRKDEVQRLPEKDSEGNVIMDERGMPKLKEWRWEDFERKAEQETKQGKPTTPEEVFLKDRFGAQISSLKGMANYYLEQIDELQMRKELFQKKLQETEDEEEKQKIKQRIEMMNVREKGLRESAAGQLQQASDMEETVNHLKPLDKYALGRSVDGYAQAGLMAHDETKNNPYAKSDVYVGPEIGWPQFYGSHPKEFIDLIKKSQQRMIQLTTNPKKVDIDGNYLDNQGNVVDKSRAADNPNYRGWNEKQAKEAAQRHIKGMFDTSHMGMWLANFQPIKVQTQQGQRWETEDERLKRFNKWYLERVKELADSGVIGGIQLVDSASAAHGHLPAGQGIFPVKEAAKIFKDKKFTGYLVSEGHEEEAFGEGRIMTKTWETLGAAGGPKYFAGAPNDWRNIEHSYFGKTYSPNFIFGSYSPSNEFKLWSEIPLE